MVDTHTHTQLAHKLPGNMAFQAMGFNASGMSAETFEAFLITVELSQLKWDAILVQEGPSEEEDVVKELSDRHLWCVGAHGPRQRSTGILLHKKWKKGMHEFRSIEGMMSLLDVEIHKVEWRLISCHLPHSGYSYMEFDAALVMLSDALPEDRIKVRICIGIDANAEVGQQNEHVPKVNGGAWHWRKELARK